MDKHRADSNIAIRKKLRAKRRLLNHSKNKTFQRDSVSMLHLFPVEIWHFIVSKLMKHPDDLDNFLNSSLFFRDLAQFQRTSFYFERVLSIMAPHIWKIEGLQGFPVTDILNCRATCCHWNTVVKKLVLDKFRHFRSGSTENQTENIWLKFDNLSKTYFELHNNRNTQVTPMDLKSVHKFLQHFEKTHPANGRNPFIWNALQISLFDTSQRGFQDNIYQHNLEGITTLLNKYGKYVHNFEFTCDIYQFYERPLPFHQWFLQLPNLKRLTLNCYVDSGRFPEFDINEWKDYVFPKFKNLRKLQIDNLPKYISNPLILQNNQVSTLILESWEVDCDFFTFSLPNLKTFETKEVNLKELVENLGSPKVQWPLESLTLHLCNQNNGCGNLLKVIQNKFASTLVYFSLFMQQEDGRQDECPFWQDMKSFRLNLPKLRKIKIEMLGIFVSLDFLLPMKHTLKEISVVVDYEFPVKQSTTCTNGNIVQFVGFEGNMLRSNIWMIFKCLKKIEVKASWKENQEESRWYSREDWMINNEYF